MQLVFVPQPSRARLEYFRCGVMSYFCQADTHLLCNLTLTTLSPSARFAVHLNKLLQCRHSSYDPQLEKAVSHLTYLRSAATILIKALWPCCSRHCQAGRTPKTVVTARPKAWVIHPQAHSKQTDQVCHSSASKVIKSQMRQLSFYIVPAKIVHASLLRAVCSIWVQLARFSSSLACRMNLQHLVGTSFS